MRKGEPETPEDLLKWALEAEDQAKYETAPHLIARCLADRDFYLQEAAKMEREQK